MLRSKTAENTNICKLLTKLVQIDSKPRSLFKGTTAVTIYARKRKIGSNPRLFHFCMSARSERAPPGSSRRCTFHQFQFRSRACNTFSRLQHFSLISVEKRRLRCQQQQLAQDEAMHRESFHLPAGYFCYMGGY